MNAEIIILNAHMPDVDDKGIFFLSFVLMAKRGSNIRYSFDKMYVIIYR